MTDNVLMGVVVVFLGIFTFAFCALFQGFLVMLAWNAVIPKLFSLDTITYLDGFWLTFLSSLLFKTTVSTRKS
jgi:hypothetical protein